MDCQMTLAMDSYRQGHSAKEAAKTHGVSRATLYRALRDGRMLRHSKDKYSARTEIDPSMEEIWEEARKIRESWSEEEMHRRWVGLGSEGGRASRKLASVLPLIRLHDAEAA
jgi:transposase